MSEMDRRGFMGIMATLTSLGGFAKRFFPPEPELSVSKVLRARPIPKTSILVPGKWFLDRRKDLFNPTFKMLERELPGKWFRENPANQHELKWDRDWIPILPEVKDEWWDMLFDDIYKYHSYVQIIVERNGGTFKTPEGSWAGECSLVFRALMITSTGDTRCTCQSSIDMGMFWDFRVGSRCREPLPVSAGPLSSHRVLIAINSDSPVWQSDRRFAWALVDGKSFIL